MNRETIEKTMRGILKEAPESAILMAISDEDESVVSSTINTEAIARTLYSMIYKPNDPVGERVYEICKLVVCNIIKNDDDKALSMRIALNNAINKHTYESTI